MIQVPGIGPSTAKLAIVGEAPGREEERLGLPFVGPSGRILDDLLKSSGISREDCYITNVCKVRPPANNLERLGEIGKRIDDFIPLLWDELNALKPNAILAFGNTALYALTGNRGIEHFRGSILQATRSNIKVIPTIHPASLLHGESEDGKLRSWKDITYIRWDVERAVAQSKFPDFFPPARELTICRSNLDLYRFLDRYSNCELVSVDIESYHTLPICISFAFNKHHAISVPLFNNLGNANFEITRSDLVQCWKDIADLLANPAILKIGQNFKYDTLQLDRPLNGTINFGLPVRGFYFDTMLAFRTLYPELPGKLEFITSVLTEEPYYKEEGKGYNPKKDKLDRLLLYNAKDAVVTYECFEVEQQELRARHLEDFFFQRVMPISPFYSRIEQRGILRDDNERKRLKKKYAEKVEEQEQELAKLLKILYGLDNPLNANSPKQVSQLLYQIMRLPQRKGTDEKTLDALMRNVIKDNDKRRVLEIILEIRKTKKTIGTYIDAEAHPDGRVRTGYNLMLESGRTSTRILKPPVTTEKMGLAFQTITKHGDIGADIRGQFIPDTNHVFLEPDLSQAEARVVAVLARDKRLIKIFKYGVDIHSVTYGWMENLCPDALLEKFYIEEDNARCITLTQEINYILKSKINDELRQIGKKFRHAGHYDMGKREASLQTGVSEWKAGQILNKFHNTNSSIRDVFHAEIQQVLAENGRKLVNPFGRERIFLNKWGQDLFKEAYAQIPQSTVSDQVKFAMRIIEQRIPEIKILVESHDSFLAQLELLYVTDKNLRIIQEELERPIDFTNCTLGGNTVLVIPSDMKIGEKNWLDMRKVT